MAYHAHLEKLGVPSPAVTLSHGRNHQPRRSLWALSSATFRRGDTGSMKLFFYPLQCSWFQMAFASTVSWSFSSRLLVSHQDTVYYPWLVRGDGQNWCTFWIKCRLPLFPHFDYLSLFISAYVNFCQAIQSMWIKYSDSETFVS